MRMRRPRALPSMAGRAGPQSSFGVAPSTSLASAPALVAPPTHRLGLGLQHPPPTSARERPALLRPTQQCAALDALALGYLVSDLAPYAAACALEAPAQQSQLRAG